MKRDATFLTLAALVTAGLTMRPLLTSVSTQLPYLQHALALDATASSLLAALPMLMMGISACAGSALLRRYSARSLLLPGLLLLLTGTALRQWMSSGELLLATAALGGVGIGLVQMAMPGALRQRFGQRTPAVTGLWSGALMGGGGQGAALTPWLSSHVGWRIALSGWSLLILLALALWTMVRLPAPRAVAHTTAGSPVRETPLYRIPRAWALALSFGLVNGTYASLIAWLPDALIAIGWTAQRSGTLLALMIAAQVGGALGLPLLALGQDRRPLLLLCLACQAIGLSGFLFAPLAAPWLWASVAGVGLGGAFPLTLVLALDHLPLPARAARLVAFVQGIGFCAAGAMPFIAGQLRIITGSLNAAWGLHLVIVCLLMALNLRFHPKSYAQAFASPTQRQS